MRYPTSIRQEFKSYVQDMVNERVITMDNKDDWHFHLFNEDHYIIGYYEASQWLEKHGLGELEAARMCTEYERENFGQVFNTYDNPEKVANMIAYIYGELFVHDYEDDIEEWIEEIEA